MSVFSFFKKIIYFPQQKHEKIAILLIQIFIFSLIYSFLDDSNFRGINLLQDIFIDKEAEDKIESVQKELFTTNDKRDLKDLANEVKKETIHESYLSLYFNRLYFSVITACLLGYGDIYPYSNLCKTFTMAQALFTVIIIVY